MTSIFIRTIIIYVILNIMLKIMGKRQIGELEVNELVSTLLISEIGALPISDTDIPLLPSIIPILFIASSEVIVSILKNKSPLLKRVVEGEPTYIIYKGRLRQKVLAENRISINEVLTEMRIQGIANFNDIRYAILEQNGHISITLKAKHQPATLNDLNIKVRDKGISHIIIAHGRTNDHSLQITKKDRLWLNETLKQHNIKESDVCLMTLNDDGTVRITKKD